MRHNKFEVILSGRPGPSPSINRRVKSTPEILRIEKPFFQTAVLTMSVAQPLAPTPPASAVLNGGGQFSPFSKLTKARDRAIWFKIAPTSNSLSLDFFWKAGEKFQPLMTPEAFIMTEYEIRVLREDGKASIITAGIYMNDYSAIRAAKKLAGERRFEVWRGIQCVFGLMSSPNGDTPPTDSPAA